MRRALPSVIGLLLGILCGCNTCLDPSTIPLRSVEDTVDMAPADDSPTPDSSQCGLDPAACDEAGRECGNFTWTDACGVEWTSFCGTCDGVDEVCDAGRGICGCGPGYVSDAAGCQDIDECDRGTAMCPAPQFCINTPGGFECSDCPGGQVLDGNGACVDADECALGTDNCDALVTCANADPGFACGACPGGYDDTNGDGTLCTDIDECGRGVCDANASCANLPGSFACTCNAGFAGDGTTCAPQLVAQVQQLDAMFSGLSHRVAVPAGMNAARTVPFATASTSAGTSNDEPAEFHIDVWIDTATNEVVFERGEANGDVRVVVSLVEFNAGVVQTGTFSLGQSTSVTIASVNPSQSLLTFSYQLGGLTDDERAKSQVAGRLSPSQVQFQRSVSEGTVTGHWYVVEDPNGELTATQTEVALPGGQPCVTAFGNVDLARSFTLFSYRQNTTAVQAIDPVGAHVACYASGGNLQCCRGNSGDASGGYTMTIQVQLLSFGTGTNGAVQRGSATLTSAGTNANVGTFDPLFTTASVGTTGAIGAVIALENFATGDESGAFVNVRLDGNSQLEISRLKNIPDEALVHWEIITWPH